MIITSEREVLLESSAGTARSGKSKSKFNFAKCCLIKFEDEDSGRVYHTNVVCELLDIYHCRCTRYPERSVLVPTCLTLNPNLIPQLKWMPETCAYRLLSEGKDLPPWHPLVSGDPKTVHKAGISVRGKVKNIGTQWRS